MGTWRCITGRFRGNVWEMRILELAPVHKSGKLILGLDLGFGVWSGAVGGKGAV